MKGQRRIGEWEMGRAGEIRTRQVREMVINNDDEGYVIFVRSTGRIYVARCLDNAAKVATSVLSRLHAAVACGRKIFGEKDFVLKPYGSDSTGVWIAKRALKGGGEPIGTENSTGGAG